MTEKKHKLVSFEDALCAAPLISDVQTMKIGRNEASWVWREISQSRTDQLRRTSIQWVEEDRRRKERGGDWRDVITDLDAMRANELDLRLIHAAMRDPENHTEEAIGLDSLRDRLSPDMQEHLATSYQIWRASIAPDTMSQEDIVALCEEIKKKEVDTPLLLTQFGFKTAIACLGYMAEQLTTYQTEPSLPTSSGE
jgi:hypothetical protein